MGIQNFVQPLGYDISGLAFQALSKTWLIQRQFHWGLFLPHFINGVAGPLISPFCQDIRFGGYSIQQLEKMQYGALQRFYAGLQNIENIRLSFITSVDNAILDYFQGWYNLMIDEEGFYYPKNNYAKEIYVVMYDRSGVESSRFNLKGTFPTNRPTVSLTYSGEDVLRLDINLSVDDIEVFSIIGSVRAAAMGAVGTIAKKTVEIFGGAGALASGVANKAGGILSGF